MRNVLVVIFVILLIPLDFVVIAADDSLNLGTVSGKINVWRTRVRTEGPKNDKDVLVYLENSNGKTYSGLNETVVMDQKNLIFLPHILPVQKGTSVKFLNSDSVDHNVYLLFEKNGETLDLGTWGQGKTTEYQFNESGVVIVLCKLHLEMAAYIITLNNPFFCLAAINEDSQSAAFIIKDVPPGKYVLKAWHKKLKMKGDEALITVEKDKVTHSDILITKPKYAK